MPDSTVEALIVDLLLWLSDRERTYQDVLDVWRTSCPRLPVWEDAKDRGFVAQENSVGRELVRITPAGSAFLQQQRRPRASVSKT
jgi:hypothetical protein